MWYMIVSMAEYDAFSYLLLLGAIGAFVVLVLVVVLFLNDVNRGPTLPTNPVHPSAQRTEEPSRSSQ